MTPRELEEYKELRATIRERGTTRVWVFVAGLVAWAGLAVATLALATLPVATLLPLLVLAGIFEAVFSLHVAVERIGRYLQVFLEPDPGWEHAAMAAGRPTVHTDPLFAAVFTGAAAINFVPVLVAGPTPIELAVTGAFHLAFIGRIFVARRRASRQRGDDLERFRRIKS